MLTFNESCQLCLEGSNPIKTFRVIYQDMSAFADYLNGFVNEANNND